MAQGAFGFQNPKITLLPLRSLQWSVYKLMLSNVPLTTTSELPNVHDSTRTCHPNHHRKAAAVSLSG